MKNPLINRNFSFLMLVQTIEQIGDSLTLMALIAWVMAMPGAHSSTTNMTILLFWIGVPIILVAPFSGVIIDRFRRKNLLMIATAVKGSFIFFIFLFLHEPGRMPVLYALVFMKSFATQFFIPAKSSYVPDVVGNKEDLVRANSISATAMIITQILSYAVAGLLIAEFDADSVLLLSAILYLPATLFIIFINAKETLVERKQIESFGKIIEELVTGFKFMWKQESVMFVTRRVFIMMISVIVFYISLTGGVLEQIMKASKIGIKTITALGFMQGALGLGLVLGVIVIEKVLKKVSDTVLIRTVFPVMGFFIVGLYFFNNYYYLLCCAFLGGMAGVMLLSIAETVVQRDTPEDMRGRIFSSYYIFRNIGPLIASAIAGFLIKFMIEEDVMLIAGLALVLYGVINFFGRKPKVQ